MGATAGGRQAGPVLRASALRKGFGGNQVLRGIDLEVQRGSSLAAPATKGAAKPGTRLSRIVTLRGFHLGVDLTAPTGTPSLRVTIEAIIR